jgi:hypothetical protein
LMRALIACLLFSCLSNLAAAADAPARREDARVFARDGRLLYRETHWVTPGKDQRRLVLYRCADGNPFARKRVIAADKPESPDFELEDSRDGHREGVRTRAGRREVLRRDGTGSTPSSSPLAVPRNGVIDAGVDAAVRRQWQPLMAGETVRMQFLVPSRQRFYPVKLRREGALDWQGVPAERLRMQLDQWFGFAVPPVTLTYARADQRLLEFAGTGNLRDARQDYPQVRIAFAPHGRNAAAAELAEAESVALVGRCRF